MGTVRWFGESWGAPVCEPEDHIDTPINEDCARCRGAIEEGQQGVTVPYLTGRSGEDGWMDRLAWHLDCWLAEVVGDDMADIVMEAMDDDAAGTVG